jgi:hypothetical protein
MVRRIAIAVFVATLLGTAVALAASPVPGALYTGKVKLPDYASKLKVVELRVSGNAERLKFTGPHERCGTPDLPAGFNVAKQTRGQIPRVKIKDDGSFKAHREYRATYESANYTYVFDWDIRVSGRFVRKGKATGSASYEMVTSSDRGAGGERSCGRRNVSWTATR